MTSNKNVEADAAAVGGVVGMFAYGIAGPEWGAFGPVSFAFICLFGAIAGSVWIHRRLEA